MGAIKQPLTSAEPPVSRRVITWTIKVLFVLFFVTILPYTYTEYNEHKSNCSVGLGKDECEHGSLYVVCTYIVSFVVMYMIWSVVIFLGKFFLGHYDDYMTKNIDSKLQKIYKLFSKNKQHGN